MQSSIGSIVLLSCLVSAASGLGGSPVGKVVEMLSALQQKVLADGEASQKAYEDFSEFCSDRSKQLDLEVKNAKSRVRELTSAIEKDSADMELWKSKIEDLASSISGAEVQLKEATAVRKKESADFLGVEADLVETIDTIKRAGKIIDREMSKGTSLTQLGGARGLVTALSTLVQASQVRSADAIRLTALVQGEAKGEDAEEDSSADAPDAATYESQSGSIVELLEDLEGKAEDELDDSRKKEAESQHNYDLIKQALSHEIKFASTDMDGAKKGLAQTGEQKATSEGELYVTKKDLDADVALIDNLHHDCMMKSQDFESETNSRSQELKALSEAKQALEEATGASLSQVSLLQVRSSSKSDGSNAVQIIRHIASEQHLPSMEQLALRMESLLQAGNDPFTKVKGLLTGMIDKLESQAAADATHKSFCDKALAEANSEKQATSTASEKLSVKAEQATSASLRLKGEAAVLQTELAELAKSQVQIDKIRANEKAAFEVSKTEFEKGLEGIKLALKMLRDYYGASSGASHEASTGAADGIVSLLETCETDFSRSVAEVTAVEEAAQSAYDVETEDMKLSKVAKEKDVSYKLKESVALDKALTEMSSDRQSVEDRLSAVLEGLKSLEKQCIARADSYAEKKARREQEMDGLKSALAALGGVDGAASLIQSGRQLRITRPGAR
jgi:hypothetical protein